MINGFKDLRVYQLAFQSSFGIFCLTKKFPNDEKFEMTSQIRRSSRSVCTNIVEAYRRRRYKDYFISKLNDAETENAETLVWLDFSKDCKYLSIEEFEKLSSLNTEVGKLIWYMINNPDKFL